MRIENAEWVVFVDELSGQIYLYVVGHTEAVLVTTIEKFRALGALIEQAGR